MPRGFYDLAFGVGSGGARKDTHYVRAGLEEVREDLVAEPALFRDGLHGLHGLLRAPAPKAGHNSGS